MFFSQAGYVTRERYRVLVHQLLDIFGTANLVDTQSLEHDIFGNSAERVHVTQFVASLQSLESKEERRHLLRKRSDTERDGYGLWYCFGLYHYMYEAISEMLEHMMERSAAVLKPEKEGFLLKKSGSSWAKYWFCLRNGFLFYFRDPSDCNPARVIFLESGCSVMMSPPLDSLAEVSITFFKDVVIPGGLEIPSSFEGKIRGRSQSMKHNRSSKSDYNSNSNSNRNGNGNGTNSSSTTPTSSSTIQPGRARSNTTGSAPNLSSISTYPSFLSLSGPIPPPHSASVPALPSLSMSSQPLPPLPQTEPTRHIHREFTPLTHGVVFTPPTHPHPYIPPSNRFSAPCPKFSDLDLSALDSESSLNDSSSSISSINSSSSAGNSAILKRRAASQPAKPLPQIPNSDPIKPTSSSSLLLPPLPIFPIQLDPPLASPPLPPKPANILLTRSPSLPVSAVTVGPSPPPVSRVSANSLVVPSLTPSSSPKISPVALSTPVTPPTLTSNLGDSYSPHVTFASPAANTNSPSPYASPTISPATSPATTHHQTQPSTPTSSTSTSISLPGQSLPNTPQPLPAAKPLPTTPQPLSITAVIQRPPPPIQSQGDTISSSLSSSLSSSYSSSLSSSQKSSEPAAPQILIHPPPPTSTSTSTTSSTSSISTSTSTTTTSSSSSNTSATRRDQEQATLRHTKASRKNTMEFIPNFENSFQLKVGGYNIVLAAQDARHRDKWIDRIRLHADSFESYPFGSFAPPRPKSGAKYFVDGKDYFEAVAEALLSAREQIFITDWFLSPEIYMVRTAENMTHRLDHILADKAKEGVKIYIIVWSETKFALNLNSERAKTTLEALHRNITVICHPVLLMKWSHHQKTVVVDQDIAFLGGLDLSFGRYDIPSHPLEDIQFKMFPGKDYYNPAKGREIDGLEAPFKDLVDRCSVPRMPWHDVSVRVDGYAARDVAKNFIQRWNHHRNDIQMVSPLLVPKTVLWPHTDTKNCQILRSLSNWSGQGCDQTESSVCTAMLHCIKSAKHFVYIENQYFISSTAGGKVKNEIGEALIERLRLAIIEKRTKHLKEPNFRVIIVLPVHPEGTYKDSNSIRYIMKWQYDSICRGGNSILERLQTEFPEETISDFISFHALRNYGVLEGKVVTEQIYVHSKLMIVDDRTVIIGSANINDRSLLGDRDSEIAVVIEDETLVPSKMGGQPYMACKFALSLRLDLWREHLALDEDAVNTVLDPLTYETYELIWRNTAHNNTTLYSMAFGVRMEADYINSVKSMAKAERQAEHVQASVDVLEMLTKVQGHLISYPLHFLTDSLGEAFSTSFDIMIAGDEVFQ